jgi:mRNA interferase YafQ
MYTIDYTNKFQKDYKKCLKRGLKEELIKEVISILATEGKLPAKYKAHKLKGNYTGLWECHIIPDWLLVWDQSDEIRLITLTRTGTHSDLF